MDDFCSLPLMAETMIKAKELMGLGVDTQVQTATAISDWGTPLVAGTINNVLARLKGTDVGLR